MSFSCVMQSQQDVCLIEVNHRQTDVDVLVVQQPSMSFCVVVFDPSYVLFCSKGMIQYQQRFDAFQSSEPTSGFHFYFSSNGKLQLKCTVRLEKNTSLSMSKLFFFTSIYTTPKLIGKEWPSICS